MRKPFTPTSWSHYAQTDFKEIYPFQLKGKTIEEAYFTAANVLVIVFTDGTSLRIWSDFQGTIEIKKA